MKSIYSKYSIYKYILGFIGIVLFSGSSFAADYWVKIADQKYTVEIANNDALRARGLMFRESMPVDRGMLFIHDSEEPLAYWMKNTLIPLDILYFDSNLKLVSKQLNVPPCPPNTNCPPYPSYAPARYVLELNAGQAEKLNLVYGAKLQIDPSIQGKKK